MKVSEKCRIFAAPFITAALLLIIYAVKGIYPFGNITIDYYDMAQQIAAFYYHVFDVLHGTKSLFYDPYTALGVNMAMSTSGCSNLSIFNLFFLFIKRNMLLESLSFFLMLKLVLMSITMGFYLRKSFKIPAFFEILFSIIYAFSGFVFVLYVTIQWLDIAVLFPLVMYYLKQVLHRKRYGLYILFLTMSLVASYYLTFMVLIYIILMTGMFMVYDFIFADSKEKADLPVKMRVRNISLKYNLTGLLLSTVVSLFLSMFIVLPQLKQTLSSARFKNGTNSSGVLSVYFEILKNYKPAYTTRWWTLLSLSFCFAVIAFALIKYYKNKKVMVTVVCAVLLMSLELFFENINLIWHFGSYVQYPIRNGFTINFTFVCIAAYFIEKMIADKYIENVFENIKGATKEKGFYLVNLCAFVLAVVALTIAVRLYSSSAAMPLRRVFHITVLVMAVSFIVYIAVLFIKKGKCLYIAAYILCAEIIFYGFLLIGKPTFITGYAENPEQEGEYIRICSQLEKAFLIEPDAEGKYLLERVKNPDESLNANYPLVLRKPALSNWTHIISPRLQNSAKKLGYSIEYTRLLDCGGTVFSDALLGVNEVITCVKQDDALYELKGETDITVDHLSGKKMKYYCYSSRFKLPFGVTVNDNEDFFENEDTVDIYNDFYALLSDDKNGEVAEYLYNYKADSDIKDSNNQLILNKELEISGNKALYYLASQTDTQDENTVISVNDREITIPSIKETDNRKYPAKYNNNAVYLGCFNNETVKIDVVFDKCDDDNEEYDAVFEPRVIAIDLDRLSLLCSQYNNYEKEVDIKANTDGYEVNINSNKKYLILPVSYDEGLEVTVDGVNVKADSLGDMFTLIPLNGGKRVCVKFVPSLMKEGVTISLTALLLLAMFILNNKYSFISDKKDIVNKVNGVMSYICLVGYVGIIMFMYVIPVISGVVLWII